MRLTKALIQKKQELEEGIQNAVIYSNEELLYTDTDDGYAFFQITEDIESRDSVLSDDLESARTRITFSLPEDFKGYYPTIGTVMVMNRKGEAKAYFLDEHGSIEMPGFIEQRKPMQWSIAGE